MQINNHYRTDIINKNYMDSVLQVTANDELLMNRSPARSSMEKKRRRMEFRVILKIRETL